MKKNIKPLSRIALLVFLWTGVRQADAAARSVIFTRDATYEEYLHIHANPDEDKITPIRVIRWMMGRRGHEIMPPSSTEFQPVVDANQHRVRAVAAVAYKFF